MRHPHLPRGDAGSAHRTQNDLHLCDGAEVTRAEIAERIIELEQERDAINQEIGFLEAELNPRPPYEGPPLTILDTPAAEVVPGFTVEIVFGPLENKG